MAKTMGVGTKEADYYSERLFASGLWKVTSEGVCTNFDFLDLGDLSIKDYLASTVYIIAHLSEKKPYSYDTLSIVTSRSHVRNFLKKVNLALKELHESSAQAKDEKNCLFSWTHSGTIEIQLKDKVEKE